MPFLFLLCLTFLLLSGYSTIVAVFRRKKKKKSRSGRVFWVLLQLFCLQSILDIDLHWGFEAALVIISHHAVSLCPTILTQFLSQILAKGVRKMQWVMLLWGGGEKAAVGKGLWNEEMWRGCSDGRTWGWHQCCSGKAQVPIAGLLGSPKDWRAVLSYSGIKAGGRVPPDLLGT